MDTFGAGIIIASGGCIMILAAILYVICGTMLPAIWIFFIYMARVGIVFPNTMTKATQTGIFYGFLLALLAIITSFLFQYLVFHSI